MVGSGPFRFASRRTRGPARGWSTRKLRRNTSRARTGWPRLHGRAEAGRSFRPRRMDRHPGRAPPPRRRCSGARRIGGSSRSFDLVPVMLQQRPCLGDLGGRRSAGNIGLLRMNAAASRRSTTRRSGALWCRPLAQSDFMQRGVPATSAPYMAGRGGVFHARHVDGERARPECVCGAALDVRTRASGRSRRTRAMARASPWW